MELIFLEETGTKNKQLVNNLPAIEVNHLVKFHLKFDKKKKL